MLCKIRFNLREVIVSAIKSTSPHLSNGGQSDDRLLKYLEIVIVDSDSVSSESEAGCDPWAGS